MQFKTLGVHHLELGRDKMKRPLDNRLITSGSLERYVWLVKEASAAKIAWIKESSSGIYFMGRPTRSEAHFSFHSNGRKHFKTPQKQYWGVKQTGEIARISKMVNVGGCAIEFDRIAWQKPPKIAAKDISICQSLIQIDTSKFAQINLYICPKEIAGAAMDSLSSKDSNYRADCICIEFPVLGLHLNGLIQLQFSQSQQPAPKSF